MEPDTAHDGARPAAASSTPVAAPAPTPGPPTDPVAVAVARLNELPQLELAEHPPLFQDIHSALQQALASIDNA